MFGEMFGLPAHPLLVHFGVVFGPLLIVASVLYALVPTLRRHLGWVVLALGVAAPAALWFAKLSGERLFQTLVDKGYPPQILSQVDLHKDHGDAAAWAGILLGGFAIALVLVSTSAAKKPDTSGSKALIYGLSALTIAAAVAAGYYIFLTGDSGAQAVWGTI
ncbi:DUF2231 domain-containing protein [Catellatospora sp. NPDC049609]|uniref:DUF2231 domain-containing protein n=1 Tax=Catellatospora sp. NPDC049609 TaxID=3155505 RepID=UPI00342DCE7E